MNHFTLEEIVDQRTFNRYGIDCWQLFPPGSLTMLENVREFFGVPLTCNNWHTGGPFQFRGYRPAWCNVGAKGSPHRKGRGWDVDVANLTAEQARQKIIADQNNPLLANIKRLEGGVNWLHLDDFEPPQGKNRIYVFHP